MKKGSKSETTANLRQKAEDLLKKKLSKSGSLPSEAETKKLIHELEVHQIELELQNEELALAKDQGLKVAAEKYAELYNFAPAGIFTLSPKGEIIDINLYGSQMLGRESLHLKNSVFTFFVSDDTKPIFNLFLNKIFKNKTEESCQVILSESVNPPMYLQLTGLTTKNGEQCLVTAVDISKLKRMEDALAESETKYRTMVTQSPDGFFIADLMGNFLSVNKSMCDVLKYSEEEFLSMKILDIMVEQNQPNHRLRLKALLNGESTNEDSEYEIKGKDGIIHSVEVRSSLITKGKEPIGFQGIAHEITKRKKAEKVLRESEEKYRNIFENIQDVYYETSIDGIILEVSPSIRFITKNRYKREDVIGRSIYDFYANPLDRQTFMSVLQENGHVTEFEIMLKSLDGLQIPCTISSKLHFDAQGHPNKIVGSINDITERKRSEQITAALYNISKAVNTSNTLQSLFAIIHETLDSIIIAKNFYIALIDNAKNNIEFLYEIDESSPVINSSVISLDDSQSLTVEVINSKKPLLLNEEELNKRYEKGKNRLWSTKAKCWLGIPLLRGEEVIGAMAVQSYNKSGIYTNVDVELFSAVAQQVAIAIQHKRDEEELAKSELRFRELYQNAKIGLYRTTPNGTILMANIELVKMLGYSSFEELAERNLEEHDFEPSYERKEFIERIEKYGEINDLESTWTCFDGSTIFVRESTRVIRNSQGKTLYYDGVAEDITEHKQAMESIRQYREQLEFAFNGTNDGIWDVKMDTGSVYISPRGCEILGYHPEDFYKNISTWNQMVHPEDLPSTNAALTAYLEGKTPIFMVEERLKTFTGDYKWILTRGKAVSYDSNGKALRMVGTHTDISEQKKAENAMIASETRYRRLFESAKDGILILDAETGKIMDVNPFLVEMLGYSHEEFIEKAIWEIGFFKDIIDNHDKFLELQKKEYVRYDNLPLETAAGRKINVEFVSNVYLVDKTKVIQCNIRNITERKRIENALIISETHLRMLVQTIPDLIWTKDADGIFLSCNAMFERFFGASEDDIIGKTDYDFVDRELADFFRENDRKAMKAGKPTSNEEWITFADDGHRAYLETIKAPMYDDQNRLIGVLGIGRDITDRKNAEHNVKESEKRFRAIFSQAPIGIALINVQGQLVIANLPLSKMVGYSCDELSKKKFADFTYAEDIDKDLEQFANLIDGKISMYSMEKRYVHKNGNLVWANLFVTILRDENGNFQEILGMAEDITERKKTEEALQESLERYKTLTLISPVGIFHTDENGSTTFVNPTWCQISGLSFEDALGDGWLNAVHPDDKEKLSEGWEEATQNQKTSLSYYRFVRTDGSIAWVIGQTTLETNAEGKTIGYIGTITDITERKHAEDTLKDNNIFLQTLLNAIPAPVFYKDIEGRYIGFNKAFELFFGKTTQELAGKTVFDINPRELAEIYHAKDMELFLNPGEQIYDSQMKDFQGTIHDVVYHKASTMDSNGHVNGLIGVILDISERKQAEKVLNDLIDKNPLSIQIMDKHGFTLKVNTAYSSLFGAIPPPNFSVLADLQNKGFGEYIQLAKKGEVVNFPDIYYNVHDVYTELPDKPVWIRAVLFSLTDPNSIIERFVFMHEDITERMRAEKEITMLAQSLRSVNELVSITDTDNKIFFANDSFLKTYGYQLHELIGKNISLVQSGKNVPEQVNEILPATILGEWKGELMNTRKDGSEFPIYLSTATIKDNKNNILGLIGVATDITERKRAEKELIEAKDKAEENDRLKTAFLQNISHEIRTPMNAIVGFSELVEMEIDDPEKIKDYTKIIRQRSDELLGIINDLLDIAHIESDQLSIKYNQIDLNLLFEDIRSLYAEHKLQIEKSSINLIVKGIPANLNSIVSTDIGKLKQIFSNLIHNAFKFTSEGKIEFGFHSISNNNITFFVSDSGPGISENIKDLIFERFRKSANESIYVQDGMGLGLAIVKGLLKLFNGQIRIESEPNKGSTFYFTIPYIPISVKTEVETPVKNQKYDWSKFKLLIVEDDKFNIAYFTELLGSTGINLLIGETGSQAISLFTKNQNIDLVLMDIKLPDMSGYEVTMEFKKIRPKIRIIAQTAYAAETDKQKALDAGCDDFITKPIKRNSFLELINGYLITKSKN